jgi:hypothetical protein
MEPLTESKALDRHALVMAIWLALGLVATALFDYGFGVGGAAFILAAYGVLIVAFIGHVIVNAVYATAFTPRELALGLVVYGTALLAFGLAVILSPGFAARAFLPLMLGFVVFGASVIFYMITHFGVRRVFDAFDVIRDFRTKDEVLGSARRGERR